MKAYIASYGHDDAMGVYVVNLDEEGHLRLDQHLQTKDFPSYLVTCGNLLYASMKNATKQNTHGGVASFKVLPSGYLDYNDNYASSGRSYTHLCVDAKDHYLFAANYHVGTTAAYVLKDDGCVLRKQSVCYHEGAGPDPLGRQTMPHVHCVGLTPDQHYVYAVDLGADQIVLYDYRDAILKEVKKIPVLSGSGPRHMIFSEDGRFAYLVNEISNTLMVFKYHEGHFCMIQMINTTPRHFHGESSAAAIHMTASQTHILVSNRGHDSLAFYSRNKETGKLVLLYMVHCGHQPRDFYIWEDRYVLIACQGDDHLEVMRLDVQQELLEKTEEVLEIPQPVCVVM